MRSKKARVLFEVLFFQIRTNLFIIEKNQKKKVFASYKLKDAEFLGQNSTLLIVEGNSAMGGMAQARDYKKYGILAIRGKIINCLSNPEEKIFENEEIKLLAEYKKEHGLE